MKKILISVGLVSLLMLGCGVPTESEKAIPETAALAMENTNAIQVDETVELPVKYLNDNDELISGTIAFTLHDFKHEPNNSNEINSSFNTKATPPETLNGFLDITIELIEGERNVALPIRLDKKVFNPEGLEINQSYTVQPKNESEQLNGNYIYPGRSVRGRIMVHLPRVENLQYTSIEIDSPYFDESIWFTVENSRRVMLPN